MATRGILARKALKMATGTLNFKSTHTILPLVLLGRNPGSSSFVLSGVLNSTDATYSRPPDCSIPEDRNKEHLIRLPQRTGPSEA